MKNNKTISILIILAIFVIVNLLSDKMFFRLDFTSDGTYTLSESTKNILSEIDEPLTIKAYFSGNLPPHFVKARGDFKALLTEFAALSKGNLVYEFINPSDSRENESEAIKSGVEPVMINLREKDEMKQQKAYLGAAIYLGSSAEAISFIRPGGAMEYELISAIKKLLVTDKTPIGLVGGQGEPSIEQFEQAIVSLEVMYDLEEISLDSAVDQEYKTIAIVDPSSSFSEENLKVLDEHLSQGGNIFIALDRVEADMQNGRGESVSTGLEIWLGEKGLQISDEMIVDNSCGMINVQEQQGMYVVNRQIDFPYLPIAENFEEHPITSGIERIAFEFVSPINYVGSENLKYTSLIKSSEKSGVVRMPVQFYIEKPWADRDYQNPNQTILATLEGKIVGENESKIVITTDGDFVLNGEGEDRHPVAQDNVNLFVNSIDWLSGQTELIELRNRGVSSRPLGEIEDDTKMIIKYSNFLLPILLVIFYGMFRFWSKKKLRYKRMNESYS
jgi:gliding motility-associatede transport system auxiliary component